MSLRVLVVEDEPLLALDIAHHLEDAGFEVVGPASSVARALRLIDEVGCDAAVLDINLGPETAELVAEVLLQRGTPFVSLSGYSSEQRPAIFQTAHFLTKPARPEDLIALLNQLIMA